VGQEANKADATGSSNGKGALRSSRVQLQPHSFMIYPISRPKLAWDYFILDIVIWNIFYLPFEVAFQYGTCTVRIPS
jgi:hypothetical protein